MIQNTISYREELLDIHEYDGTTTSDPFAIKSDQNFEENIDSISYVIVIFQVTKTNMYFILTISEGSICIYAFPWYTLRLFDLVIV